MDNPINNNIDYNNYYNNIPEQMIPDINDLILEQKQFVDDDYLLNLHQKLAQIREQRKLTEDSIKILNSRINCLEKENSRTLSKINITNQKTNNRLLTLEQKKNHSREKNEYIKKIENDLKKLKQKNKNFKLERDKGLINSRVNVISKNKLKGQQSKQEKENIENIIRMEELNEQNMKKNNVDVMRSENIANVRIKKLIEIQKKEVMIKDLEEKINAELDRKNELEKNIDKMLQEESETLERINKTEQKQKKLFQDFQKALEGNDNFYNIYNLNNNPNNNEQNAIENQNENGNENNDVNNNENEMEHNNNIVEEK
jgi:hypothetical protein